MQNSDKTLKESEECLIDIKTPSESIIKNLSLLVQITSSDEESRIELARSNDDVAILMRILKTISVLRLLLSKFSHQLLRLLRGVFLLLRNISTCAVIEVEAIVASLYDLQHNFPQDQQFYVLLTSALLQALANLVLAHQNLLKEKTDSFLHFFLFFITNDSLDNASIYPAFLLILRNWLEQSPENTDKLLNKCAFSVLDSLSASNDVFYGDKAESYNQDLLSLHLCLILAPQFSTWLCDLIKNPFSERCLSTLRICQLSITHVDSWDCFESERILSWIIPAFNAYATLVLDESTWNQMKHDSLDFLPISRGLEATLDPISHLCFLGSATDFLRKESMLELLTNLLRALHQNNSASNLTSKDQANSISSFPGIKSIIIEILGYLCHDSYYVQEQLRELHCMELILSNCVIDRNNPYIRERSILCLRFLLEENKKNQDFVAQLEAKKVTDESALQRAGLQVEIIDGKVHLKESGLK